MPTASEKQSNTDNPESSANNTDPAIVFLGTPEFSVASLDALLRAGYRVVGVVTAPDKPAGRGMKMNESAVKKYAKEKGLRIIQPEKLKSQEFLSTLKDLKADLQVVVAFRILPEAVWSMPRMGTINVHASLLPQYRGAAPINWAIINGEKETGVTTFKLQQEVDTGNILLQAALPIGDDETAGDLHDKMKEAGANLLIKTIKGIIDETLHEMPQDKKLLTNSDSESTTYAPKISTDTCHINWENEVTNIFNLIRGLSPFPGAFTELNGKMLKIYKGTKEITPIKIPAGSFETDKKHYLKFACADGWLYATEIQLEGKKRMKIDEFLRGYRFS
jgi:methionyl-tRNA formyltransferase